MKRECNKFKQIGAGLLAIGIGGLITYYLIEMSRVKLLSLSTKMWGMTVSGDMENIGVGELETLIFLVSIFALFIAPLFIQWDKKAGMKILILFLAGFAVVSSGIVAIIQGEVLPACMIIAWLSFSYIVWFILGILKILYSWIKAGTTDSQFDMVKLTFIWTVIAFIIGKVW